MKRILYFFLIVLLFTGCAKRGFITGGLKDTIPPVLRVSEPKNFSTQFRGKEIKLHFDEYVKLKDLNKQLIVSPPMKNQPEILPSNATKTLTIRIKDTLLSNTTYSFNFGQSIQDNNEGNPYPQFKYIFSTGDYIDSLQLKGKIKDAYSLKTDNFVSVMLYEKNETFYDSIVYKEVPRYITNTLDSLTTFTLENLKAGNYLLVAIKDDIKNNKFDPKKEKIGFYQKTITIPNDTLFELELFKEILPFKPLKTIQQASNRIILGYEGKASDTKITLKNGNEVIPTVVTPFPKKDSLQIWFKPMKDVDSLKLHVKQDKLEKEFTFKYRNQKADSLKINAVQMGVLHFRETYKLNSSIPLKTIDEKKMILTRSDSSKVEFTARYLTDEQQVEIDFKKEPEERYKLLVQKGAIIDFFDRLNDSIQFQFATKSTSEYGNLKLQLEGLTSYPVIVDLTDEKGEMLATSYLTNNQPIEFNLLLPRKYIVRIIYDTNQNKVWDTGNFIEKRQSEEVRYFPTPIDVRSNWDVDQTLKFSGG